jgi:hypothetical protein
MTDTPGDIALSQSFQSVIASPPIMPAVTAALRWLRQYLIRILVLFLRDDDAIQLMTTRACP